MVKNTILDMATAINQKEVAFLTKDTVSIKANNHRLTDALKNDLGNFNPSSVTASEVESLDQLKNNLDAMFKAEAALLENEFSSLDDYKKIIERVNENMDVLAHIQMKEGKKQLITSQRNMAAVELFTQVEIIFLVLFAAIALIIIFRKTRP